VTGKSQFLRAAGVATLLDVSERTVRRWIADGRLPSVKIGGTRFIAITALDVLLGRPNSPVPADLYTSENIKE
jgi:excisionase family DNA binding protein